MKVAQSCPTLCDPMDYTVHEILQARILEWVAFPFSRGSSQPKDQAQVSCIAGRFFTRWTTREPKNTGVSSLSLLQGIFQTQESNWGLLHCRQVLYQLRYQGMVIVEKKKENWSPHNDCQYKWIYQEAKQAGTYVMLFQIVSNSRSIHPRKA